LIFDFDGLLMDSEWPAFAAWSSIYQRYGVSLALADWVACVGTRGGFDPALHLQKVSGLELDGAALFAEKEALKAQECATLQPMPGVQALVAAAKESGWQLAVASSSARDWVEPHLQRMGLILEFRHVVTSDDVQSVKPAPDLYLRAASLLSVEPKDCVVLEDSLNGVLAAKAAGMYCVAVPNRVTANLDFSPADRQISSLEQLSLQQL